VVELRINPPFGGNLLVQASGIAESRSGASVIECVAALDQQFIGEVWLTHVPASSDAGLAVTGASTVAAGPHTVRVLCHTGGPTENDATYLTTTALVTG
jgi:hypothetical protein